MTTYTDTEKFLQAVFGSDFGTRAIFANLNPPAHSRDFRQLDVERDCYWSIAAFDPGHIERTLARATDVRALVIDDVGTKVPVLAVEMALGTPTAIVETSLGNFQWVYRLSAPVAVGDWAGFFAGVEKRINYPLEGRDAVHLFRLPMGVNTKPSRGGFAPQRVELNAGTVFDVARIVIATDRGGGGSTSSPDGKFKHIRRLVALVPNSTGYHAWIARMYQIWVLAEDKEEGREAWLEFCERWVPPPISTQEHEYDPADKWDRIREGDTDTLGQLLLDDARTANPDEFARIMKDEADAVFDDGVVPPGSKPAGITATLYKWVDLDKTEPRDWLYGDILLRKFISMTVAPGGVGKSSLVVAETLAQVTGRNLLGDEPAGKLRVWLWNLEDPYAETQLRIQAAAKHYGISEKDIGERLFVDSGRDQRLVVAEMRGSTPMPVRPVISALVEQIRLRRIDVVVIDPFVSCHGVPENDNTAQDMVVKEWGRVAEEGNCAVHLVDHTRKAGADAEVTTESSRGAKAKTDAARVVRVVNRMSATDSRTYGIAEPWRYFNTFNDKANMAPPKAKRDWFRMESIWAGNGRGAAAAFSVGAAAVRLQGDSVGVAISWAPPSAKAMAAGDAFSKVVKVMGTQRWRMEPRSPDWIGFAIAQALQIDAPSISGRASIKTIIKTWISEGLFKVLAQPDENRKMKDYIEIAQVY